MNEVLLFSDLHINAHKRRQERLDDCLNALNWVFDVADQHGIENILFGGDLFHDRQKIEVLTYQRTFETLFNRLIGNKYKLYLLLGNHDIWYNDDTSISSVIPLSTLPGVKVISKPERINICGSNWDFIPFTHNPISTLEELSKLPGKPEYALGHIAVDGAILHGSHQADVAIEHDGDMVAISPALFKHYIHTFFGHYHAEQRVSDTVEYIGSPLQLSYGEAFQNKHLIRFDCKKNIRTYVQNNFSPKHLIIGMDEIEKYDLKGNFVQIRVDDIGATDLLSMKKDILSQSQPGSLEIKHQKKKIEDMVIQNARAILYKGNEMLSKYIDEIGYKNLDRDELLSIGQSICQKEE